jgi:sugar lactone lactonase YvrE
MTELTVIPVPGHGTEDVVVDDEGWVYTGTVDGSIWRVQPDGRRLDLVGNTGGRPLGIELLPDGRLLICDAHRGLLALDRDTGRVEVLTGLVHGRRMEFCNNAAVRGDGTIWFTDSSRVHGIERWRADMVENTSSGRLFRRDPDGHIEVLVEGLRFANGVALAADESYVAVAQTAGRSVVRHWLAGDRAGRTEPFISDLPGYPDNIARGSDGLIWIAVASSVDPLLERLMRAPGPVRRVAWRTPRRLHPKVQRTARAMAFDDSGALVHDADTDASRFHMVTGVREHQGRLWLGSLEEPAVAVLDTPTSG